MLIFDFFLVVTLGIFIGRKIGWSLLNPLIIYYVIHVLFITIRNLIFEGFNLPLLSSIMFATPLTRSELNRGIFVSDLALIGVFFGSFLGKANNFLPFRMSILRARVAWKRVILDVLNPAFLALSLVLLILSVRSESTAVNAIMNYGVSIVLILVYCNGLKKRYLVLLGLMFLVFFYQGYHRYRIVLPLYFLTATFHSRRGVDSKKSYRFFLFLIPTLLTVFILWIFTFDRSEFFTLLSDFSLLEQSSAIVSEVRRSNYFYGSTYLIPILFWIPSSIWQDKPALNWWMQEISSPNRQFFDMGHVALLPGESYANFGLLGSILVPLVLAYFAARIYKIAIVRGAHSIEYARLLFINMLLFQIWRDGVSAIILFPLLNYLPLALWLYLIKRS